MSRNRPGPQAAYAGHRRGHGERIHKLSLGELYPNSLEIYLAIEFDDETEIEIDIDVASRLSFGIKHHALDENREMEPVK